MNPQKLQLARSNVFDDGHQTAATLVVLAKVENSNPAVAPATCTDKSIVKMEEIGPSTPSYQTSIPAIEKDCTTPKANKNIGTLGYAFLSDGWGYEGPLTCLTGVDAEGWTIRVELTKANPFEWTDMLYDSFYDQFRCLAVGKMDPSTQNLGT